MRKVVASKTKIKLSCQNIWKIYGDDPNQFFNNKSGLVADANGLARDISASNHIVANADVSFDVYAGEIFVIMGLSGSGKSTIVRCLSPIGRAYSRHNTIGWRKPSGKISGRINRGS